MKMLTIVFALLVSTVTFAGPGHGHSHGHSHEHEGHGHSHGAPAISKEKAMEVGKYHMERLTKAGKIDASWKDAKYDTSVKKTFGHNTEWVVTFNNDKGVKGKKLYIFLKESGEFVAANFTGK